MSSKELLDMIAAALAADKKAAKGRKAASGPSEINGVEIVDESAPKRAPGRPKKAPAAAPEEPPARAPKAVPSRKRVEVEEPPKAPPKPTAALALKKSNTRPMPHKCDCPLCPLKD